MSASALARGAGVAGLGFVLPRGPGSGEGAVAHKGSPPLLSSVELGGWSRVRGCWRRGRVGAVVGWAVLEGGGPSTTWAQMSRTWFLRIPEPPSKISVIQDLEQTRPALYSKFSFEVSKKPTRPSSLFPGRARR